MLVNFVEYLTFDSAQEFLHALLPDSEHFRDGRPLSWFFRGLLRADHRLIPTALRSESALNRFIMGKCQTNKDQIIGELKILTDFFEIADLRGLWLPEDSQHLRALIKTLKSDSVEAESQKLLEFLRIPAGEEAMSQ